MELYGKYDVIVVGGGCAGCAAAISSARAGAKTILIERFGALGGMLNISGPPGWAFSHLWNNRGEQIIAGIVEELHHRLEKEGLALPYPKPEDRQFDSFAYIDPDWAGLLLFQMMQENKVDLLLHSLAVDVIKEGDNMRGVIVENTSGRMAVLGDVVIECTGEGDIAVRAGAPYTVIDRTKEEIDPPSITFHMDGVDWDKVTKYFKENPEEFVRFPSIMAWGQITTEYKERVKARMEELKKASSILDLVKAGKLGYVNFYKISEEAVKNGDLPPRGVDLGFFFTPRQGGVIQPVFQHSAQVPDCDITNVRELTWAEIEARRQVTMAVKAVRKYLPGFKNAYLTRLTFCVRGREGRHFIGDYQLTSDDVAEARKFPDVIAKSAMNTNIGGPFHSCRYPAESMNIDPKVKKVRVKNGGSYDIPYRCLVPKNVENLLLAGKCISVSEDFKRDCLPENMATGQAAGVAAAICAKKNITPRQLEQDVSVLQKILQQQGVILYTKY
ncbi:MAG: FAD-dependent oxidoreductase [Candidatus Bathyarchaeia archaeon]